VVVLHGAFSSGGQTETETGFSLLADRERFLVAYPEGIGLFGLFQHWNAGHCCGKAADDQVDDVAVVAEMISLIRQRVSVDPARIYLAGMSNGGMLTYRFAAERAKDLAAAAVVCGAIDSSVGNEQPPWRLQAPVRPVPMMIIHGQADDAIPADGGPFPVREGKRSYRAAADAAEFWRTADGCGATPVAMFSNNDTVKHLAWNSCLNNSSVEYFLLKGWGHQWPSGWFLDRLAPDHPLRGFDATKEIWDFFVRFSNPDAK
jgi:polyhydroxybutyrate depolymerase